MSGAARSGFDKRAYYDAIAGAYDEHVVDPYALGVAMPLKHDIGAWVMASSQGALAVDFGCGPGRSLEMLEGSKGLTLGLDYSAQMLCTAAARLWGEPDSWPDPGRKSFIDAQLAEALVRDRFSRWQRGEPWGPETQLVHGDMHNLGWLEGAVSLAIASNSVTDETGPLSKHMFEGVARSLAPGGEMLALFPSLDATQYVMGLHRQRDGRVPPELGHLDDDGVYECDGLRQKFWAPRELHEQCTRFGLEALSLTKIYFDWAAMNEAGWGNFADQAPMWDWYLRARKIPA